MCLREGYNTWWGERLYWLYLPLPRWHGSCDLSSQPTGRRGRLPLSTKRDSAGCEPRVEHTLRSAVVCGLVCSDYTHSSTEGMFSNAGSLIASFVSAAQSACTNTLPVYTYTYVALWWGHRDTVWHRYMIWYHTYSCSVRQRQATVCTEWVLFWWVHGWVCVLCAVFSWKVFHRSTTQSIYSTPHKCHYFSS